GAERVDQAGIIICRARPAGHAVAFSQNLVRAVDAVHRDAGLTLLADDRDQGLPRQAAAQGIQEDDREERLRALVRRGRDLLARRVVPRAAEIVATAAADRPALDVA